MQIHRAYVNRISGDIEELSARIYILGSNFAHQKAHIGEQYHIELGRIRACFTDLRVQVREMHEDNQQTKLPIVETACQNLLSAVDHLIDILHASRVTGITEFCSTAPKMR